MSKALYSVTVTTDVSKWTPEQVGTYARLWNDITAPFKGDDNVSIRHDHHVEGHRCFECSAQCFEKARNASMGT